MSVPSLTATQMACNWELRASIERAAYLTPKMAADSTTCLDSNHIISNEAWHANCIQ